MLFKKSVKTIVYIDGMNCGHCAAKVEKVLNELSGGKTRVDLAKKCAYVKSSSPLDEKEVFDTISNIGFKPVKIDA